MLELFLNFTLSNCAAVGPPPSRSPQSVSADIHIGFFGLPTSFLNSRFVFRALRCLLCLFCLFRGSMLPRSFDSSFFPPLRLLILIPLWPLPFWEIIQLRLHWFQLQPQLPAGYIETSSIPCSCSRCVAPLHIKLALPSSLPHAIPGNLHFNYILHGCVASKLIRYFSSPSRTLLQYVCPRHLPG